MSKMRKIQGIIFICVNMILLTGATSCGENEDDPEHDGYDDADDDDDDDTQSHYFDDDIDCAGVGETDDYGITWVDIPAGSFMMGCSPNDDQCTDKEYPVTEEYVSEFQMTKYMITQKQFALVMDYNPSNYEDCPDCPVDGVDFLVAQDFCEQVGGRLPEEKEWEYAARAGTETKYYCGDDPSCLDDIAWYVENSGGHPHIVGQKEPNDYCLYDTAGNLHEYTAIREKTAPRLRSGGFLSPAKGLRHSYPHDVDLPPYDVDGIRCARDA